MEDLRCDEDFASVASLMEAPAPCANPLETPAEFTQYDGEAEQLIGNLPARCDEDHACRLSVLLQLESRQLTSHYLRRQPFFDATHRFAIVQWLHVACFHFKLNLSALAIAVRLLDRFLDVHTFKADQLRDAQCVAVACLTLAAKMDGPDAVDNVVKFQVDTDIWSTRYTAAQIRTAELAILSTLDWRLHCATAVDFLDCLLCLANVGRSADGGLLDSGRPASRVRRDAHDLIFQTLADSNSVAMRPSCMAAAAILIAMQRCGGSKRAQGEALFCFCGHLDWEELQWSLDQMQTNVSGSGEGGSQGSVQLQPPSPGPVTPPAVHPPLQLAYAVSHNKQRARLSPTSVLMSAGSLPSSETELPFDSLWEGKL